MNNNNKNNAFYKIGIKRLDDLQLEISLPNYTQLLSRIKEIREKSPEIDEFLKELDENSQINLMYDNVFSILGGRGTGKSSLLKTMREKLQDIDNKKDNYDIYLPIISAETLMDEDTIMGWILLFLEKEIGKLENELKTNANSDNLNYFYENCQLKKENNLRKSYNKFKDIYFSQYSYKSINNYGFSESIQMHVDYYAKKTAIIEASLKFWNEIILALNLINQRKEDEKPLIFIFIDDIDLDPIRSLEILDIIPKYLSHPHVVLVVASSPKLFKISARYNWINKIFQKRDTISNFENWIEKIVFENSQGENSNGKDIKFEKNKSYKTLIKVCDQLVDKAFPPVNRFYIKKYYILEDKKRFILPTNKDNKKGETVVNSFIKLIKELKESKLDSLENEERAEYIKKIDELKKFCIDEKTFPSMYVSFLGDTSREICNVMRAYADFIEEVLSKKKECDEKKLESEEVYKENYHNLLYDSINRFLKIAVDSNYDLKFFCNEGIMENLFKRKYCEWNLYIDYNYLVKRFNDYINEGGQMNDDHVKRYLKIFSLLHFVENIIVLVDKERLVTHGKEAFYHIIKQNKKHEQILHFQSSMENLLNQVACFYDSLYIIQYFDTNNFDHINFVLNLYNQNKLLKINDVSELLEYYKDDMMWGKSFFKMLYNRFSSYWLLETLNEIDGVIKKQGYEDKYFTELKLEARAFLKKVVFQYDYTKLSADVKYTRFYLRQERIRELAEEISKNNSKEMPISLDQINKEIIKEKTEIDLITLEDKREQEYSKILNNIYNFEAKEGVFLKSCNEANRNRLLKQLRQKYPGGLIDEFRRKHSVTASKGTKNINMINFEEYNLFKDEIKDISAKIDDEIDSIEFYKKMRGLDSTYEVVLTNRVELIELGIEYLMNIEKAKELYPIVLFEKMERRKMQNSIKEFKYLGRMKKIYDDIINDKSENFDKELYNYFKETISDLQMLLYDKLVGVEKSEYE